MMAIVLRYFRNKWDDENSLINNHITALNGDYQDRIWIGTQKGVSFFDYANSSMRPVFYLDKGKRTKITAPITTIAVGKNGSTYFATDEKGLFVVRKGAAVASRIAFKNVLDFTARGLVVDEQSNLWVFIKDFGLCKYNEITRKFTLEYSKINFVTVILNTQNGGC